MSIESDIFISYRRVGGDVLARLIYEALTKRRYAVFFDHESLSSGVFGEKINETLQKVRDVIVVLSKDCLERCNDPEDWMYREIKEAISSNKNIILVFSEDFEHPSAQKLREYPQEIQKLLGYQGYLINVEHFDNVIKKLCNEFESSPQPLSSTDINAVVEHLLKNGMNGLPADTSRALLSKSLETVYDDSVSKIMDSFIDSNTKHYNNIRTQFRYEIEIESGFRFRNVDIDEDVYFELSENLWYKKELIKNDMGDTFWISFVRDLDKLDDSLRDENFLFSENLIMDNADLQKLIDLDDDESMDFYRKSMRARVNINGKVLQAVKVIIDDAGIFAKYQADELCLPNQQTLEVKIAFSIPMQKSSGYFFASISDPTFSPYIRFSYPEDEMDVKMIPFMSRATTAADTKIFDGLRELTFDNEWVLPMSGATFIITLN